jgi:hypothetical protein
MCDSCKYPKEKLEVKEDMALALKAVQALKRTIPSRPLSNL